MGREMVFLKGVFSNPSVDPRLPEIPGGSAEGF